MARPVKLALSSTLLGILGWHGVFLLLLIVAFKLFLWQQEDYACPCTWSVAYGTLMFLFPSLTSYMVAFFSYLRQDNDSVPWKVLKKFYEFKLSCDQYDERTPWKFHTESCFRCRQLKRDWFLVKITLSAVFSFLYPLIWLSLSFLQAHYYVCAQVGPSSMALTRFCNVTVQVQKPDEYDQSYGLAIIRSKSIGSIMLLCTLFSVGVTVILYGEIENYLYKKYDWPPSESGDNLQVLISVSPVRSPRSSMSSHCDRHTPITSALENAETERQSPSQPPVADGSRTIRIHLSNTFAETLQGCLQDGAWQGIDIRCSQHEESRSRQGSFYSPFRYPSQARFQHQRTGDYGYESLPQLTENSESY